MSSICPVFKSELAEKNMTVVSNGSACVVGSHNYVIKKDARFLINSAVASMGYGSSGSNWSVYCIGQDRQLFVWRVMEVS